MWHFTKAIWLTRPFEQLHLLLLFRNIARFIPTHKVIRLLKLAIRFDLIILAWQIWPPPPVANFLALRVWELVYMTEIRNEKTTLFYFYNYEPWKNKLFLILHSRLTRYLFITTQIEKNFWENLSFLLWLTYMLDFVDLGTC